MKLITIDAEILERSDVGTVISSILHGACHEYGIPDMHHQKTCHLQALICPPVPAYS